MESDEERGYVRVLVLWSHLPRYAFSCLREAARRPGLNLDVVSVGPGPNGVLSDPQFGTETLREDASFNDWLPILQRIRSRTYDVVVAGGWGHRWIIAAAATARAVGVWTVCMADTPWIGDTRQKMRVAIGARALAPLFNAFWVPGERGVPLAAALGFRDANVWKGLYSADDGLFGQGVAARLDRAEYENRWPARFVFVGRLAPEKNVNRLIQAYQRYRLSTARPWELVIAGDGPLRKEFEQAPGVLVLGWLSPEEIACELQKSGALILPSLYEPWGVVIHEGTCAGLPTLCSTRVGASADLIHHGVNGYLFDPLDIEEMARTMVRMSEHQTPWHLGRMSMAFSNCRSRALWADTLVEGINRIRRHRGEAKGDSRCY